MHVNPIVVAALVVVGTVPAFAHPPGANVGTQDAYVHQHLSHGDVATGATCGLSTANPGVLSGAGWYSGTVECGPLAVANSDGGSVNGVTLCAEVQVNNSAPGNPVDSECLTLAQNVGMLVATANYLAVPGDVVFLCTYVAWTGSNGSFAAYLDSDPDTDGTQCKQVTGAHPL